MPINSTEVSYGFGQMGSVFSDTTGAITPPANKVFVAITMYAGTGTAAHDAVLSPDLGESGTGGDVINNGNTFPKGITIYGRWTKVTNNAATPIMLYIGD